MTRIEALIVQREDNFIQRIKINELVGVHFIRWVAIYPLDNVIHSQNNQGQLDTLSLGYKVLVVSKVIQLVSFIHTS